MLPLILDKKHVSENPAADRNFQFMVSGGDLASVGGSMVCKISSGAKITNDDFNALNQEERKLLGQLVKELRDGDKLTPDAELRESAYHMVQTRLIECN